MAAGLVLGPLLRYAGETEATIWVETDAAAQVEVLGATSRTFAVQGHHFALVHVEGLEPGSTTPYEVHLDGELVWPDPLSNFPPSVVRTTCEDAAMDIVFGSCRVCAPHVEPWSLTKDESPEGREVDSLRALALRMRERSPESWPHALVLLGDQVYADEVSPQTCAFIRQRRDADEPPGQTIADFEEYCQLYRESWSEPTIRWLLSTVSSAMIFDDHDVHDDWNTSQDWVDEMRATSWWDKRIVGALMSYWCYQHIGNLAPRSLREDEMWRRVRELDDAGDVLADFAFRADRETDGAQWSYCRDFGTAKLVMIDSRAGRVLEPGRRSMLDEEEWRWVQDELHGDLDHLLIGTSLPWLLLPGLHGLEAWNEAVCDGRWGRLAQRVGEKLRTGLDLEHWAAFNESFRRLADIVEGVAAGRRGEAPASIIALSGDVHHAYVAEASWPGGEQRSKVYQAVCSPFRNPLDQRERRVIRFAGGRVGAWVGRTLSRAAGVQPPPMAWRQLSEEPFFDNQVATLRLEGRHATVKLEKAPPHAAGLELASERALAA